MAAFIAKQMVGNKLSSVKGALGGGGDDAAEGDGEKKEGEAVAGEGGMDPEVLAAIEEAEAKRKDKHRRMEEERENIRQDIRNKYGLKKKEEVTAAIVDDGLAGRMGRQKKTPEELANEALGEDEDENSFFPASLEELQAKVGELPAKMSAGVAEAKEKCVVQ